ncbi:MAG: hypothetical protein PHH06_04535 [Candidatus Gracilibacteria bacterium]|nr:hypothetical protein [Candidatus Gracilibacteria bacterium]
MSLEKDFNFTGRFNGFTDNDKFQAITCIYAILGDISKYIGKKLNFFIQGFYLKIDNYCGTIRNKKVLSFSNGEVSYDLALQILESLSNGEDVFISINNSIVKLTLEKPPVLDSSSVITKLVSYVSRRIYFFIAHDLRDHYNCIRTQSFSEYEKLKGDHPLDSFTERQLVLLTLENELAYDSFADAQAIINYFKISEEEFEMIYIKILKRKEKAMKKYGKELDKYHYLVRYRDFRPTFSN